MDFVNFGENWKNRPKIIFSDFLKFSEGRIWILETLLEIQKIAPKMAKMIFSYFLQVFWREKWTLEILVKIKKITQKSLFGLFAVFTILCFLHTKNISRHDFCFLLQHEKLNCMMQRFFYMMKNTFARCREKSFSSCVKKKLHYKKSISQSLEKIFDRIRKIFFVL